MIRDLVTDVSFNYEKGRQVPAFEPPADLAPGDYRMAQVDVERSDVCSDIERRGGPGHGRPTGAERGRGDREAGALRARTGSRRPSRSGVAEVPGPVRRSADLSAARGVVVSLVAWALEGGKAAPYDAIVISAIVIANAVLGYVQEARAEQAVAALQRMSAATAGVVRDGREERVPAAEVVPGDILMLAEGDAVARRRAGWSRRRR